MPAVATPSTMNSQRQPRIPCAPSRVEVIAPETMLPKAPERMPAVRKMMKRLDLGFVSINPVWRMAFRENVLLALSVPC